MFIPIYMINHRHNVGFLLVVLKFISIRWYTHFRLFTHNISISVCLQFKELELLPFTIHFFTRDWQLYIYSCISIGQYVNVLITCKHNSSLMARLILMKLYTVEQHYQRIWIKEYWVNTTRTLDIAVVKINGVIYLKSNRKWIWKSWSISTTTFKVWFIDTIEKTLTHRFLFQEHR